MLTAAIDFLGMEIVFIMEWLLSTVWLPIILKYLLLCSTEEQNSRRLEVEGE